MTRSKRALEDTVFPVVKGAKLASEVIKVELTHTTGQLLAPAAEITDRKHSIAATVDFTERKRSFTRKSEAQNNAELNTHQLSTPPKTPVKREHIEVKLEHDVFESVPSPSATPNVFAFADSQDASDCAPPRWADIYNEVVKMRSKVMTPVDHHGCSIMPETINNGVMRRDPRIYRFQLLISLMLSAQTKDEVNFQAMDTLHKSFLGLGYSDGLCLQAVLDSSQDFINQCISKVGFHHKKAAYIKKSCDMIRERFNDDIPNTIEEIVLMPGVGPKMGYLLLQLGWNINHGIGVDVHIHRLAQMWGWTTKKAKLPEQTRLELQDWLPEKYWADINPLLVGFGQTVCAPNANNCDVCTLASSGMCKAANKKLLATPITIKRILKLQKQRGDLTPLLPEELRATTLFKTE